ncbi:MAG TPA: manganese efflux pump, partial [Armatimonadota bacterium]|nr:manganese efflux pump [Armatimonadota bacterium]
AISLGSDAFSVAICVGLVGATAIQKLRLALGFGIFQFIMPVVGLIIGKLFGSFVGVFASYIGGLILIGLGTIIIWRSLSEGFQCPPLIHQSFLALVTVSIGVSIDALAVGIGYALGVKEFGILPASAVIGVTAFFMTIIGAEVGGRLGMILHHWAPIAGGSILTLLGILILAQ